MMVVFSSAWFYPSIGRFQRACHHSYESRFLILVFCWLFLGQVGAGQNQCWISISTNPSSPVPYGTSMLVTATLNGDVVQDNVIGSFNFDGTTVCNLAQGPSSCSGTITPSAGSHTFTWSCSATGAGGNGTASGSQQLQVPLYSLGRTFFGLHLNNLSNQTSLLNVPFGTLRLWDTGTTWSLLNPAAGTYDWTALDAYLSWAQTNNYEVIYTFGYVPCWETSSVCEPPLYTSQIPTVANIADWDSFVSALVNHAAGKIKYYEIWNEPNQPIFWAGSTSLLKSMAKDAFQTIKSVDPLAQILTPAPGGDANSVSQWMDSYLSTVLPNNDTNVYADIIAFHGYNGTTPENIIGLVNQLQQTLSNHSLSGLSKFDSEASWGTFTDLSDQDEEAAFVGRSYALQASMGIDRFVWYGWDYAPWGTLWQPLDASPPPSPGILKPGMAYGTVAQWMIGKQITSCSESTQNIWNCPLFGLPNYQAQILWSSNADPVSATVSPQFTQSRDLLSNCNSLIQDQQVTLGHKPLLVETPYIGSAGPTACWWEAVQSVLF